MNMDINVGVHVDMYKNKIIPVQYNTYIYMHIYIHMETLVIMQNCKKYM